MDKDWFRRTLRARSLTTNDLAIAIGRDRSVVSRILNGHQPATLEVAKLFAETLKIDVAEVLERLGMAERPIARIFTPGFAESDATPFDTSFSGPGDHLSKSVAAALVKPGIDIWTVKGGAMSLGGYLSGDFIVVDSHQSERVKAGDVVIAQIYQRNGTAMTVLRRFEPPVLVAASADPADGRVYVVDCENVVIKGKVIASWRI